MLLIAEKIGHITLSLCTTMGAFFIFFLETARTALTTRIRIHRLFEQMEQVGVNSLGIVLLTGTFTGAVLAVQSYIGFKRYGGTELIGPLIALGMARELGPVITGLMVTGRAGSAMAAELGTMNITEQKDALITLNINPFQYLVVPRMIASTLITPFLTISAVACGIAGGYVVGVYSLGLSSQQYLEGIRKYLELSDIMSGLIKSAAFGFILAWVGCFKGFSAHGGARGVGIATTQSVVMGSIMLLIANYFLTVLLF